MKELLITREDFIKMTGSEPEEDDLERVNCNKAGTSGHYDCGVCKICNLPQYQCMKHIAKEVL